MEQARNTKVNVLRSRVAFGSAEHEQVDLRCAEYKHTYPTWFIKMTETLKKKNGKPLAVIAKSSQFMDYVGYLKLKLVWGSVGYVGIPTNPEKYDELFRNLTDKRLVVIRYNKDVTKDVRQHKAFVTFVRNITERFRICDGDGIAIESDIHVLIYTDETVPTQDFGVKFDGVTDIVTEIEVGSYDVGNNAMSEEERLQAKLLYQNRLQKRRTDTCDGYVYKKCKTREIPVGSEDVPNVAAYKTRVESTHKSPVVNPKDKKVKKQKSKSSDKSAQLFGSFDVIGKSKLSEKPAASKKDSTMTEDEKHKMVARAMRAIQKGGVAKEIAPDHDDLDFTRLEFPALSNSGNK